MTETTGQSLNKIFRIIPYLTKFPVKHFLVDYDKEVDVLHISFERPQNATDNKMLTNDSVKI